MKKCCTLILVFSLLFSLSSCKYKSSYFAIGLVKINTNETCSATFMELDGTLVFKLKKTSGEGEGDIHYTAGVGEGRLVVYYDIYDYKSELLTIKNGEEIDGRSGYIEKGKTVYIIIEAFDVKNGYVNIDFNT